MIEEPTSDKRREAGWWLVVVVVVVMSNGAHLWWRLDFYNLAERLNFAFSPLLSSSSLSFPERDTFDEKIVLRVESHLDARMVDGARNCYLNNQVYSMKRGGDTIKHKEFIHTCWMAKGQRFYKTQSELIEPVLLQAAQLGIHLYGFHGTQLERHLLEAHD